MNETERLDQIVRWLAEVSGQIASVQVRIDRLENSSATSPQYWSIVITFIIAAAIIAATLIFVGAPR